MSTSNRHQLIPLVQGDILTYREDGRDEQLRVSSPAWYMWLETATTFAFRSEAGSFTARKEQAGHKRGGWYWRAYRKRGGKLHSAYIGPSEELTLERLNMVAATLARTVADERRLSTAAAKKQDPHRREVVTPEPPHAEHASALLPASRPVVGRLNKPPAPLPVPLTSLIGRECEIAAACTLLAHPEVRLLTLTGTAGVGKTCLALAISTRMQEQFPEGVYFVSLAPMTNANLVLLTLAQALGLQATSTVPPLEHLKAALRERHLLVLLDNFEQVVEAAPHLVELLAACPRLKLLVTSRERLHVRGEHTFAVEPLALPDARNLPEKEALERYGAIALFLERAREVQPTFQLSAEEAPLVAEICRRLEGLPLAIELAAARLSLLPLRSLLERLAHPLQLLTGGARDLPARQHTLRDAITWSYDLLSQEEQRLFRLLAVFVGGFDLAAAEALYRTGGAHPSVLDMLTSLLDKHLLYRSKQSNDVSRLLMHEMIREYGLEALTAHGELAMARQMHALYYLGLAEEVEPHLESTEQLVWLARLEREHANLRSALGWLLEQHDYEMALRLSGALFRFWEAHGYLSEGRYFLERALASSQNVVPCVRAKALTAAGLLALQQGDFERGAILGREAVALHPELGDSRHVALAHLLLGHIAWASGDFATACSHAEAGQAVARAVDATASLAWLLDLQGLAALDQGEDDRAQALLEEGLLLHRKAGDWRGVMDALFYVGRLSFLRGKMDRAHACNEEYLTLSREMGFRTGIANGLSFQGCFALQEGDLTKARELFQEGLALLRGVNDSWTIASCLQRIGVAVAGQGRPVEAAWLWGAAERLCEALQVALHPIERAFVVRAAAATHAALGEPTFKTAWVEGRAMTPEQVLASLQDTARSGPPATRTSTRTAADHQRLPSSSPPGNLTAREMEVLRLVAQGLTDAQIAEALVISPRTVNAHLRSIYRKLGIPSRTAATRYALEHHLA